MNELKRGEYFGQHYHKKDFDAFTITDTEYTHEKVDWHYHENPYFTYLLQGKLYEANKKEAHHLTAGNLLFHNWQDAHYNLKPPIYTRGFHIEFNAAWFERYQLKKCNFEGSLQLKNPALKRLMNQVFYESKISDNYSKTSIELLMVDLFATMEKELMIAEKRPTWAARLEALLREENKTYSLADLSAILELHPVHLSRSFHRCFGMTLGAYMRLLKVNKAVLLLAAKQGSLTEICYECGFYDQSHFILNFKRIYGTTPSKFLKQIS